MYLPFGLAKAGDIFAKFPQQKIAQATIILLIGYIAYVCAQLTWLFAPQSSSVINGGVVAPIKNQNKSSSLIDMKPFHALNLFGLYVEKPTEAVEPIVEEITDAPETRLNISLSGLVASNEQSVAAAIIESSGKQETYGIGDKIVGTRATLEQVLTDRVIIKQAGRHETLMLDGFDYGQNNTAPKTPKRNNSLNVGSNASRLTNRPSPDALNATLNQNRNLNAKALRSDIAKDPGKITDYLRISPERKAGKMLGYRLRPGKDPSLFQASGLQSGDIAVEINGLDLTSTREAAQALVAIKTESQLSIIVKRGEQMEEVFFSLEN